MVQGRHQLHYRLAQHKGMGARHMGHLLERKLLVLRYFFLVFLRMVCFLGAVMLGQKSEEVVPKLLLMVAGVRGQLIEPGQVSKGNMDALQKQHQGKQYGKRPRHSIKIVKSSVPPSLSGLRYYFVCLTPKAPRGLIVQMPVDKTLKRFEFLWVFGHLLGYGMLYLCFLPAPEAPFVETLAFQGYQDGGDHPDRVCLQITAPAPTPIMAEPPIACDPMSLKASVANFS